MTEERFKAWYHGAMGVAALVEVFTAKTTLRKGLLFAAAGWHAKCVAEHLADQPKQHTFPNKPLIPKKTVVFDQERCTAWEETRGGNKTGILRDQPGVTTHSPYELRSDRTFFKSRGCI